MKLSGINPYHIKMLASGTSHIFPSPIQTAVNLVAARPEHQRCKILSDECRIATDRKDYPFFSMSLILNWSFLQNKRALRPRAANELLRI